MLTSSTVTGNPANGFIAGVGADALDFYSAHYYANCGSATLADGSTFLRALRAHVNAQGGTSLPLHLTEWNTGLGERCGTGVYSEARMQSWTSGIRSQRAAERSSGASDRSKKACTPSRFR